MGAIALRDNELETRLRVEWVEWDERHEAQLLSNTGTTTLPGQPRQSLSDPQLLEYLQKEHLAPCLDKMAPKLRFIATPKSDYIWALHHQAARGRQIILTEMPNLHLVWHFSRVFIKPIPPYMFSQAFWTYVHQHSTDEKDLSGACAGFMRSYSYLIRYQSDFEKAVTEHLIPSEDNNGEKITFERFARFVAPFAELEDDQVSPRYHYGELRLTRLNVCARFLLGKLTYFHINAQWASYLKRYLTPMITTFAILSVVLNAMQVALAAQDLQRMPQALKTLTTASWHFSVAVIILAAFGILSILLGAIFMLIHEQLFAIRVLKKKRRKDAGEQPSSPSSNVVSPA